MGSSFWRRIRLLEVIGMLLTPTRCVRPAVVSAEALPGESLHCAIEPGPVGRSARIDDRCHFAEVLRPDIRCVDHPPPMSREYPTTSAATIAANRRWSRVKHSSLLRVACLHDTALQCGVQERSVGGDPKLFSLTFVRRRISLRVYISKAFIMHGPVGAHRSPITLWSSMR
jgi:hypothetical protein